MAMSESQGFISKNMEMVAYHDLDERPGFKMAIQEVGGRWYMYIGHFWHRGWTVMDITRPSSGSDQIHPWSGQYLDVTECRWPRGR